MTTGQNEANAVARRTPDLLLLIVLWQQRELGGTQKLSDEVLKCRQTRRHLIFTHIAEEPLLCVVKGCGHVLEDYKRLQRVLDTPEFVRAAAAV